MQNKIWLNRFGANGKRQPVSSSVGERKTSLKKLLKNKVNSKKLFEIKKKKTEPFRSKRLRP
jgi:hypothetical protein